jgi:hypothetical protein
MAWPGDSNLGFESSFAKNCRKLLKIVKKIDVKNATLRHVHRQDFERPDHQGVHQRHDDGPRPVQLHVAGDDLMSFHSARKSLRIIFIILQSEQECSKKYM